MNPTISIIVPVYKVEKYIRRCLDSILAQTFTDWECILVDDGSPDNSGKICDEYAAKDGRFRVFHQENAGVSAARNKGLDEAKGEWIGFVDSDDWVKKEMLAELYEYAEKNEAEVVVSGFLFSNGEKNIKEFKVKNGWLLMPQDFEWYIQCPVAKLFKTTILQKETINFPIGISMAEDLFFTFLVYLNSHKIFGVSKCYYYYYQHSESVVHTFSPQHRKSSIAVRSMMRKKLQGLGKTDWKDWLDSNIVKLKHRFLFLDESPNCKLWRETFPETNTFAVKHSSFPRKILYWFVLNGYDKIVIFLVKLYKILKNICQKFISFFCYFL